MAELRVRRTLHLDHGGPLLFPGAIASLSPTRPDLLLRTDVCRNAACRRFHVSLDAVALASDAPLAASSSPGALDPEPLGWVLLDAHAGEVLPTGEDVLPPGVLEIVRRLLAEHHGRLLETFRRRWRHVRDTRRDGWKQRDWSWWSPGDLVSWSDLFPDDPNLLFRCGRDSYWADDQYCVAPQCRCRDVRLTFALRRGEDLRETAHVVVDLHRWRVVESASLSASGPAPEALWDALRRSESWLRDELEDRWDEARRIGPP